MVEARHQQHDALAVRLGPQRPGHGVGRGESGAVVSEPRYIGPLVSAVEIDPHEEIASLEVVELLRLEDVEAALVKRRRDLGDDPWPIGAGESEDMAGDGHRGLGQMRPAPAPVGG